jgi:hypothetical protein
MKVFMQGVAFESKNFRPGTASPKCASYTGTVPRCRRLVTASDRERATSATRAL